MRRIGRIVGRSDDMLIIRGVNVFPAQIEELIVGMPALAPHYVLEVGRAGHLDTLTVRVELAPGAGVTVGDAAAQLAHEVKAFVGISVEVCVEPAGTLARSGGKAQRVIDRRRAGAASI
jgi:phenylacetate-CoA ligase